MLGGVQVSSAGKLPFGPKGAVGDTALCVSLSPGWGFGKKYLVGLCQPQTIAPSGLPNLEHLLLSNLHPKSQTLSSPELHQSHQQTSPSSLTFDSLRLSHPMIFSSSFPTRKLQTHGSCSTTRFQPGPRCCFEPAVLLLAARVHSLCLHGQPPWIS